MKIKCLKDPKKSFFLFLLLFVTYSLIYTTKNCYSAAMASIVDAGVMTTSQTGLIAACFYLVYAPFQIIGGIAADKIAPEKLLFWGMIGAGICNLLIFFIQDYVFMIIIWSLNAICQFGVWPATFKMVSTQLAEEHREKGVFYINFTSTVGLLVSYLTAIFISEWTVNFIFSAIMLFALAVFFIGGYRHISRGMIIESIELKNDIQTADKLEVKRVISLILKSGVPLMLIVCMTQGMLNLGLKSLAPVMLMESYENVSPAIANALNLILIAAAPVGFFISRMPILKKFSEPFAIAIPFMVALPLLFLLTFIGNINLAVVVISLAVLMVTMSSTSIFFSYISKEFVRYGCVATLSGLFNCMSALGIVLANYVFAKIAESSSWEFTAKCWLFLTAFALLLSLIVTPVWKKFKKS